MSKLPKFYQQFKRDHAKMWQAFDQLGAAVAEEGPLDAKTRELVKLGMSAANKSETGVQSHTHRALEAGASQAEVEHAVLLGITTLGFPTMMMALCWARAAMDNHSARPA